LAIEVRELQAASSSKSTSILQGSRLGFRGSGAFLCALCALLLKKRIAGRVRQVEKPEVSDDSRWEGKDACVLPEELKVDPLLAALLHTVAFLELSGEGTVDPDWSIEALEHVAYYLQRLPPDRIDVIRAQLAQVAQHVRRSDWGPKAVEFFEQFLANYGVEQDNE
jgi:hypothetical protein